jgi:hypothetical protein
LSPPLIRALMPNHEAEMEANAEAMSEPNKRRGNPAFVAGAPSVNPSGRPSKAEKQARRDALVIDLAAEFGGLSVLTVADRIMLTQCAELLLRRPSDADQQVRVTNAVTRIIGGLRKHLGIRPGKREEPVDVDVYLAEAARRHEEREATEREQEDATETEAGP